jgi:hypothetical protein
MIKKEQLSKMKWWHYCSISKHPVMTMSGWKLYIFGCTVDDSYKVCVLLSDIAAKYNVTMKVASQAIINRNTRKWKTPCWSIAVIYLNTEVFQNNQIKPLVNDIMESLNGYDKTGTISGAKSVNGKVHYRFDLKVPVNPSQGVLYEDYISLYRGEYGDYNIPQNDDIEHFFK